MPANSSTILALKPIGFRLNDWQMRPVKVSNLIQYNNITCEDKPKNISLKFSDIYKTITVEIKKPGETSYTSITVTSGLNDITSFLAEGNNQIRIHNQVAKPSSFSRYQRKVTF